MDTAREIGRLDGRCDGLGAEIAGMRGQLSDIHQTVGALDNRTERIEQKLDRVIGSGPHATLSQPQEATEQKDTGKVAIASRFLSKYGREVILALGLIAMFGMYLSAKTGRPLSSFLPWADNTQTSRPALDHSDQEHTWPASSSSSPRSALPAAAPEPVTKR